MSGKETDNLTENILLDWRDYDSVTGRMNSFDPDGSDGSQISLSPFAYGWNNPVSLNDPNGRCPLCIGVAIALFSGHISGMIAQGNGGSYGKGFLTGAITSAIGSGVGAGMAGILGQAGTFGGAVLRGAAGGFVSGGISGGIGSIMNGSSFEGGFLGGAISGGISGGIIGGIGHLRMQARINAVKTPNGFDGKTELPFDQDFLDDFVDANGFDKGKANVGTVLTADQLRGQRGNVYNPETGTIQSNVNADAVTIYYSGAKSDIYVAKSAFINAKRLFVVVGHEFVHANHYAQGLFEKMVALYGPEQGNIQFGLHSEAGAYSYSLAASKSIGETSVYINHVRDNFLKNLPSDMSYIWGWRRFNIPLKLK